MGTGDEGSALECGGANEQKGGAGFRIGSLALLRSRRRVDLTFSAFAGSERRLRPRIRRDCEVGYRRGLLWILGRVDRLGVDLSVENKNHDYEKTVSASAAFLNPFAAALHPRLTHLMAPRSPIEGVASATIAAPPTAARAAARGLSGRGRVGAS